MKTVKRARAAGTWLMICIALAFGLAGSLVPSSSGTGVAYAGCDGQGPPPDVDGLCDPTATPTMTPTFTPTPTATPIIH